MTTPVPGTDSVQAHKGSANTLLLPSTPPAVTAEGETDGQQNTSVSSRTSHTDTDRDRAESSTTFQC